MATGKPRRLPAKLLVRPSPYKGEGLRGFLLRVAERNGCGHRAAFYGHLTGGHTSQSTASDSDIIDVAEALQLPHAEIEAISCRRIDERVRSQRLFFGNQVSVNHLRRHQPAVCPRCLAERQAVSGLWDLRAVCACPQHGNWLIDQCPRCGESLKWNRGGVRRCHCGFDLGMAETMPAPLDVLVLTTLLQEVTLHDLPTHEERFHGYPPAIRQTPLNELLGLFRLIAHLFLPSRCRQPAAAVEGSESLVREGQAVLLMATMLKNWPNGLALALSEYGAAGPTNVEPTVVLTQRGFDDRYDRLKTAIASHSACASVPKFFKQALRQFREGFCISEGGKGNFLNPCYASTDAEGHLVLKRSACFAALGLEAKDFSQDETVSFEQFLQMKAQEKQWSFTALQVMHLLGCTRPQLDAFLMLELLPSWAGNEFKQADVVGLVRSLEKIAVSFDRKGLARRARLVKVASFSAKHAESFAHLVDALVRKEIGLYTTHDRLAQSLSDFYVSTIELRERGYWPAHGCCRRES